ncbi:hypothetical protein [Planctomicrobium piriforme]|uniref:Uncharacterized protein n=1 Tax=Planctomicrobium piriforme TaxID=1576369 RepID=A0A1I3EMF2_9PLAN|nr:hypothetical protein [Planctomicrobium piriforme]SFI00174.1 hypothetical protein SAMN05421753_104290 [Planctomicrobium piriforme]
MTAPHERSAAADSGWTRLLQPANWSKLVLWVVVTALTTGIPATVEAAWRKYTMDLVTLGFDDLFALTAPLMLSISVVSFAWQRGWLADNIGPYMAGAVILAGGWLGHWWGHPGTAQPVTLLPEDQFGLIGQLIFAGINQLAGYVHAYGLGAAISAVLVGTAVGVAWSAGVDKLLCKPATPPAQVDEARRNAA